MKKNIYKAQAQKALVKGGAIYVVVDRFLESYRVKGRVVTYKSIELAQAAADSLNSK